MAIELKVPSVGESISEVEIGEWLKQEGDAVKQDEPVATVESDKATLEVLATESGTLAKILKQSGETASVGDVIAMIEKGDGAPAKKETSEEPKAEAPKKEKPVADKKEAAPAKGGDGHVMPAAERLLAENGLSASDVKATGPGGRLLKEDVQRHLDEAKSKPAPAKDEIPAKPAIPASAPTSAGGARQEESVKMSPLRRTIARRLVEAQQSMAMLTTFNEIDMSAIMGLRKQYQDEFVKKYGLKLGFMSFFTKAVVDALKACPALNAEIRDDYIVYRNYFDIGIAIGGGKGLVVPVIRNAERLSFAEIEQTINDLAQRAKASKLKPDELTGGTFTITNGGVYGSLLSTPIVNPPQSGVLGMHSVQERPIAVDGQVVIRPMMYVALSYDHRIVDGKEAVTFLKRVKETCEAPARMLLEV